MNLHVLHISKVLQWLHHLVDGSWSGRQHSGLQHLPLGLLWQHDAALCNRLGGEALYQHAVKQGQELSEGL